MCWLNKYTFLFKVHLSSVYFSVPKFKWEQSKKCSNTYIVHDINSVNGWLDACKLCWSVYVAVGGKNTPLHPLKKILLFYLLVKQTIVRKNKKKRNAVQGFFFWTGYLPSPWFHADGWRCGLTPPPPPTTVVSS